MLETLRPVASDWIDGDGTVDERAAANGRNPSQGRSAGAPRGGVAKRAPWSRQDPNQIRIDTNKSRRTFSHLSMNLLIMVRRSTCRRPTKGFVWVGLGACKRGLSGLCLCLDVRLIDHTAATKAPFDPHAGNRANSMIRLTFDVNPQSHLAAAVF